MFTQCPQCQTVYRVNSETLRQAGGQVQCGQCSLRFNALARLSETMPGPNAPPKPTSAPSLPADNEETGPEQPGAVHEDVISRTAAERPGPDSDRQQERDADKPVADHPPEPDSEAEPGPEPERTDDSEKQEYDTWLGRLEQEWDPTQTGTEDAWSRAAPQVDPPPDAPASSEAAPEEDETDRAEQEHEPAPAAPEDTEQPGQPRQPTGETTDKTRGLDTGISYIEAWAEDLLAEVERAEREPANDGDGTGPSLTEAEAGHEETSPEQPLDEETLMPPEPDAGTTEGPLTLDEIPAEADRAQASRGEPRSSAVTEAGADEPLATTGPEASDAHPPETPADEEPGKEPETIEWVPVGESSPEVEPGSGETIPTDGTETGPGDKWLEETWATDTQSFQPEAWLEPDFVEQEPLPEKLEGAVGESEAQATADDHAATDPAIPPETGPGHPETAEIAGLWPEFDSDAEVEEIVLESERPAAPDLKASLDRDGPSADASGGGGPGTGPQPVPGSGTSDGATATAAAGTVQAAAVRVTTASGPAKDEPLSDEEAASTMALQAEEVARELGLPRNRPLLKWSLRTLVLLVLLALIAAGVHWQRGVLMRNTGLAPVLEKAYGIIGIPVQPQWDITAFDILDSAARSTGRDLVVMATFVNEAEFAQPYPVLRVTLENRWGQAIGQEDFTPQNYLNSFIAGRRMDAGERARAEVTLRSPGSAAEGFSVDVCLESTRGALRCLSDRP